MISFLILHFLSGEVGIHTPFSLVFLSVLATNRSWGEWFYCGDDFVNPQTSRLYTKRDIRWGSQITCWVDPENCCKSCKPSIYIYSRVLALVIRLSTWRSQQQRCSWNVMLFVRATDKVLMLETSALKLFTVANWHYHLRW